MFGKEGTKVWIPGYGTGLRMNLIAQLSLLFVILIALCSNSSAIDLLKIPYHPPKINKYEKPMKVYSEGTAQFLGAYETRVTIPLPPARNNHTPLVSLDYESTTHHSFLGHGWTLSLDYVRRSVRNGVPRYVGPSGQSQDDQLEFRIGSVTGLLVFVNEHGDSLLYRPKRDAIFTKFYFNATTNHWMVLDREGKVRTLGGTKDSRDTAGGKTFAWYASRIVDTEGNYIEYRYTIDSGVIYPNRISYDHSARSDTLENTPSVYFEYVKGPGQRVSYRKGYRSVFDALQLQNIRVCGYDEKFYQSCRHHRIKYGIESANSIHKNIVAIAFEDLPEMQFAYYGETVTASMQQPGLDFKEVKIPFAYGSTSSEFVAEGRYNLGVTRRIVYFDSDYNCSTPSGKCPPVEYSQTSKLVDVDGDGDLDLLHTSFSSPTTSAQVKWLWRKNNQGKFDTRLTPMHPPKAWSGRVPNVLTSSIRSDCDFQVYMGQVLGQNMLSTSDVLDITGDGKADFVFWSFEPRGIFVAEGTGYGFKDAVPWLLASAVPHASPGYSTIASPIKSCGTDYRDVDGIWALGWSHIRETNLGHPDTYILTALVDINGDGLLDYVGDSAKKERKRVYLNNGSGFEHKPYEIEVRAGYADINYDKDGTKKTGDFHYAIRATINEARIDREGSHLYTDLRDVNGDQIPDLISKRSFISVDVDGDGDLDLVNHTHPSFKSPITINFGTGSGFDFDNSITLPAHIPWYISSVTNGEEKAGFYDVNGDSLLDYIFYDKKQLGLVTLLNLGNKFSDVPQKVNFLSGNCANYYSNALTVTKYSTNSEFIDDKTSNRNAGTFILKALFGVDNAEYHVWKIPLKQLLVDLDGDGQVELVTSSKSHHMSPSGADNWCARGTTPSPLHKMARFVGGNGQVVDVGYELWSAKTKGVSDSNVPFPFWTVNSVLDKDIGAETSRWSFFKHYGPNYEHNSREFRGFKKVLTQKNNAKRIITEFMQGEFSQGNISSIKTYEMTKGKPGALETIEKKYKEIDLDPGRRWTRLKRETRHRGFHARVTDYEYFDSPDIKKLGLLRQRTHRFTPLHGGSDRIDEFTYFVVETQTAPIKLLVRRKSHKRISEGGVQLRLREWEYDCEDNRTKKGENYVAQHLTKGRLCREKIWRSPNSPPATTHYTYDLNGRTKSRADPDGDVITYQYFGSTSLIEVEKNKLNHAKIYSEYHALTGKAGQVCGPQYSTTTPKKYKCDRTEYDLYGRPLKVWKSLSDNAGGYLSHLVTSFTYKDVGGNRDPPAVMVYRYPNYTAAGNPPSLVPRTVLPDYDKVTLSAKKAAEALQPRSIPGTVGDVNRKEERRFDVDGNLIKATYSKASGSFPRSESYFSYDSSGRLEKVWLPRFSLDKSSDYSPPSRPADYFYTYDALDRLVKITAPDGSTKRARYFPPAVEIIDEEQRRTVYLLSPFDEVREIRKYSDKNPIITRFDYDAAGRLWRVTDPSNGLYVYKYYGDDKLESFEYSGVKRRYERSPGGEPVTIIDSNGAQVSYSYDEIGRPLVRQLIPSSHSCYEQQIRKEEYLYDEDSTQIGYLNNVKGEGYNVKLRYDGLGQIIVKEIENVKDKKSLSYEKQYNALGELKNLVYPSGKHLAYFYDERGNLERVRSIAPHIVVGDADMVNVSLGYDASGHLVTIRGFMIPGKPLSVPSDYWLIERGKFHLMGGSGSQVVDPSSRLGAYIERNFTTFSEKARFFIQRQYDYDNLHRLKRLQTRSALLQPVSRLAKFETLQPVRHYYKLWREPIEWEVLYDYDSAGNVINKRDSRGTDWSYSYDGANRLKTAKDSGLIGAAYEFSYNPNSSISSVAVNGTELNYRYIENLSIDSILKSISSAAEQYQYTFGPTGARCKTKRTGGTNDYTRYYKWTTDGQLKSIEQGNYGEHGHFLTRFSYEYGGGRWHRERSGTGTLFLDDIAELNEAEGTVKEHFKLPDMIWTLRGFDKGKLQLRDPWNVSVVLEDDATIQSSREYSPYGSEFELAYANTPAIRPPDVLELKELFEGAPTAGMTVGRSRLAPHVKLSEPWSNGPSFGFAGKRKEIPGDILFFGARYYDPISRQFISIDPERFSGASDALKIPETLQPFVYAASNPTAYEDLEGRHPTLIRLYELARIHGPRVLQYINQLNRYFSRVSQQSSRAVPLVTRTLPAISRGSPLATRALSSFSHAAKYSIKAYKELTKLTKGKGLHAHHLIEKRFARLFNIGSGQMKSIALTRTEHQIFTNMWRNAIPYGWGTKQATKDLVLKTAQAIYQEYPEILQALKAGP